jgi:pilus assembly protein CpaB
MKLAVVGLTFLGLVAAVSAAFLISTLRMSPDMLPHSGRPDPSEVEVLVATGPAPAMSVVDGKQVTTKKMPRAQAPAGFISNPVEVVGKVLAIPIVEGQAFTEMCFASGASAQLAAAIPKGKRAVGISVTDYGGLDGLLYPGSVVDVMLALKPDSSLGQNSRRGPLTMTLLQSVEVLAIERQTVVSSDKSSGIDGLLRSNNTRKVTLLVDTKQTKILQLAMGEGTLSLAMRNPLDGTNADSEHVGMTDITGAEAPELAAGQKPANSPVQQALIDFLTAIKEKTQSSSAAAAAAAAVQNAEPPKPQWQITIMRGDSVETHSFALPEAPPAKPEANRDSRSPAQPVGSSALGDH